MPANNIIDPLPEQILGVLKSLDLDIVTAEIHCKSVHRKDPLKIQDEAILCCLEHGGDVAAGLVVAVKQRLSRSSFILTGALMETLFWSRYVALSEEKAQVFLEAAENEMRRNMRCLLKEEYAPLVEKDGNDRTAEYKDHQSFADIPRGPSVEDVARDGGLHQYYRDFYPTFSFYVHRKTLPGSERADPEHEMYISATTAHSLFMGINFIAYEWTEFRRQADQSALDRLLWRTPPHSTNQGGES
ncbi:MAG: DUF5677 domain-containing protein [Anaerolineales bacterium]|jgi:hypothetical protein